MRELILQEKRTLDQVLLSAFKTFNNGCNFTLIQESNGDYYIEPGCYLLPNLSTGDENLLINWLSDTQGQIFFDVKEIKKKKITGFVKEETIRELLKREPCERCGGFQFEKEEPEND